MDISKRKIISKRIIIEVGITLLPLLLFIIVFGEKFYEKFSLWELFIYCYTGIFGFLYTRMDFPLAACAFLSTLLRMLIISIVVFLTYYNSLKISYFFTVINFLLSLFLVFSGVIIIIWLGG